MVLRSSLVATFAILLLAAAGCGGDDGNSGMSGGGMSSAVNTAPEGSGSVDRAFAQAMVPHHESAVEMAKVARERGQSAFVRQLAEDIITTQTKEIETLRAADQRLEQAGEKVGSLGVDTMGMKPDMTELESAEAFDETFMKMMIEHHRSAIMMAEAERAKGQDPELKRLAEDIITAQEREIAEMRAQLAGAS